jgi:hypothetical protein
VVLLSHEKERGDGGRALSENLFDSHIRAFDTIYGGPDLAVRQVVLPVRRFDRKMRLF